MSHRLYLLVTRSSMFLILALLFAPMWDFWRYGGLLPSGGAGFPVAVIMSAPRPQAPAPAGGPGLPASTATPVNQAATAPPQQMAALDLPSRSWEQASPAPRVPASVEGGHGFEAWTARAQVDPFWNGEDAPTPAVEPAETPTDGAAEPAGVDLPGDEVDGAYGDGSQDGREGPEADLAGTEGHAAWAEDPGEDRGHPRTDDRREGDRGPVAAGDASGETNMAAGYWPAATVVNELAPAPVPDPPSPGPMPSGRVSAPRPSPGDPPPAPAAIPSVAVVPSTPEVVAGDAFTVAIRIENADQVTSLPFHLLFDPAVIEFVDSQPGTALAGHDPVLLASVSPSRPGDLAVGLSLIESAGTFTGTGEVVVLQFRAMAPGRSDVSFSRATLRGASSAPVEAQFSNAYVDVR